MPSAARIHTIIAVSTNRLVDDEKLMGLKDTLIEELGVGEIEDSV